ncbi:MAG: Uma2 family endonuclease [Longimicrobiales bacterium]
MTTDEYFRTPETLLPQELVYGLVRSAAAPTPGHQWWVARLLIALTEHVERHHVGKVWPSPVDVILDSEQHLVVQPDLIVVSNDRLHIVTDRIRGAPDLVVEILSPHPRIGQLHERLEWFARYGARECWLVHQAVREMEVIQFAAGAFESRRFCHEDEAIVSTVLPDFHRSMASIL